LEILVTKIISQKTFGFIFNCQLLEGDQKGSSIQVKIDASRISGSPSPGEVWDVQGLLVSTRWGQQIVADFASRKLPTGKLVVHFLSSRCPGIGKTRAQRLWDKYGEGLPQALNDNNLLELAEIIDASRPILALRLAAFLVSAWKHAEAESSLTAWLQHHGIDNASVVRLCADIFGINACEQLSRNPYCLSLLIPWSKCDEIGLKILSETNPSVRSFEAPQRLLGAVEAAMRDVLNSGDTIISRDELLLILGNKLLTRKDYPADLPDKALELGIQARAVIDSCGNFLPVGSAFMENSVQETLQGLKSSPEKSFESDKINFLLTELAINHHYPDSEQEFAILHAIHCGLSCLVGNAGTGKTTTLRYIVHLWKNLGGNVLMCALAGKAALRLSQATGLIAKTVARTLKDLHGDENNLSIRKSEKITINDRTLVVIDEASMIDIPTMYNILKFMVPGAKLLMCGDPAQLPPIGFGLCFHKLVDDETITTRLTKIYRQSDESGIPLVAAKIRRREMPDFMEYSGKGCGVSFIDAPVDRIPSIIQSISHDLGGFNNNEDLMIVTATNAGVAGINNLNRLFHLLHLEKSNFTEIKGYFGQYFSQLSPVIHLRNDYKRNLFNGSLGMVKNVNAGIRSLIAEFDGEEVEFEKDQLIDLALAYAITCHKCQGSQVKRVIIPIYRTRVIDPSWIYTAITRASKQVVLVGIREELNKVLQRSFASDRRSVGFKWSFIHKDR